MHYIQSSKEIWQCPVHAATMDIYMLIDVIVLNYGEEILVILKVTKDGLIHQIHVMI
jgi:hypothetical protein